MGCVTGEGARRAADQIYRRAIAAPDSLDLSAPLAADPALAGAGVQSETNQGIQPAVGQTLVVSPIMTTQPQTVDLLLINWGRDSDGNLVALSTRTIPQFTSGAFIDSDGQFFCDEAVVPINAPQYELRVVATTGVVDKIRAWTY